MFKQIVTDGCKAFGIKSFGMFKSLALTKEDFRTAANEASEMEHTEGAMTTTMTTTHSEKSHIRQMKAWPYRQEYGGHDPTKKKLLCC